MKIEFQTKESLINHLTLDGRTSLLGSAENLGVDLGGYVDLVLFENRTNSYWVDSEFVKVNRNSDAKKYLMKDSTSQNKL